MVELTARLSPLKVLLMSLVHEPPAPDQATEVARQSPSIGIPPLHDEDAVDNIPLLQASVRDPTLGAALSWAVVVPPLGMLSGEPKV